MNIKKLIIGGVIGSLALGVASIATLCTHRTLKATDLVGTESPENSPQEEDENIAAPESTQSPPIAADGAGGKNGRRLSVPTAAPDRSTIVTEKVPDGTVGVHFIEHMPETALDWAKPMHEPRIGDVIEIEVLPGRKYAFRVDTAEIFENPRKVIISGKLEGCEGTATLMLLSGKMLLQLHDYDTPIIYNLYFSEQSNSYVVQEIDPKKTVEMETRDWTKPDFKIPGTPAPQTP